MSMKMQLNRTEDTSCTLRSYLIQGQNVMFQFERFHIKIMTIGMLTISIVIPVRMNLVPHGQCLPFFHKKQFWNENASGETLLYLRNVDLVDKVGILSEGLTDCVCSPITYHDLWVSFRFCEQFRHNPFSYRHKDFVMCVLFHIAFIWIKLIADTSRRSHHYNPLIRIILCHTTLRNE